MGGKNLPAAAGAALVALIAVLVLAAPSASGARGNIFTIDVAKKAEGPYKNFAGLKLKKGKQKFLYFEVANNDTSDKTLTLTDGFTTNPDPDGYRILWFQGLTGKQKITIDVKGAGFEFQAPAGESVYFRARVNRKSSGPPFCMNGEVTDGVTSVDTYIGVNTNTCII